jgi:hypothetical protein
VNVGTLNKAEDEQGLHEGEIAAVLSELLQWRWLCEEWPGVVCCWW